MRENTEENEILAKEINKNHSLFYTKKEPRKSMNSFLRNQNKFMISGIIIADQKAMILLRTNSTIISGAIVFHDFIDTNVPLGHLIGVIIIVGLSISLILSILAARPFGRRLNNIFKKEIALTRPNLSENSFFMIEDASIEEYEAAIDKVVKSQELQIGNQVRAHYLLNRNLNYNYKLLDIAYNLFLITFILVALVFILGRFIM